MRPLLAPCHLGLGALCRRAGDGENARADLAAAKTVYRDMGMSSSLPRVEAAD